MINKISLWIRNHARAIGGGLALLALATQARADGGPTSLDGFSTIGQGYITTATSVAIAAATLGLGWVGYRLVKKFTAGAK